MKSAVVHVVPSAAANPLLLSTMDTSKADYAVVSLTGTGPLEASLSEIGIPFVTLGEYQNRILRIHRLRGVLDHLAPQAVEFHAFESGIAASLLRCTMTKRPRFIYVRHHNLNHYLMKSHRAQIADRLTARSVDHSIAVSEAVRDTMLAERVPPHAVTTVRNALRWPIALQRPGPRTSGEVRLLAVGRLDWQKDYPTMLKALRLVIRERNNVKLSIAGTGLPGYSTNLKLLCEDLGLREHVEWLGHVDDIHKLMMEYDFLVHTARDEAFGLVLLEAMQVGLPIVSTGPGGAKEVLAGFYDSLPTQEPKRIAREVLNAMDNLVTLGQYATELRPRVKVSFDVPTQIDGHLRVATQI